MTELATFRKRMKELVELGRPVQPEEIILALNDTVAEDGMVDGVIHYGDNLVFHIENDSSNRLSGAAKVALIGFRNMVARYLEVACGE